MNRLNVPEDFGGWDHRISVRYREVIAAMPWYRRWYLKAYLRWFEWRHRA